MSLFDTINILIIEDEKAVIDLMTEWLIDNRPVEWPAKYRVKSCQSLAEARPYVQAGIWDVIFLDLGLPDSKGFATFESVHKIARAPIVVLTGSDDYNLIRKIEASHPDQRCYVKLHIARCWFILHYVIKHVIREHRKSSHINHLTAALFGEDRKLIKECSVCHKWKSDDTEEYLTHEKFLERYEIYITSGYCPEHLRAMEAQLTKGGDTND